MEVSILPFNEYSLTISIHSCVHPEKVLSTAQNLAASIEKGRIDGVIDVWNTYDAVGVSYDPFQYEFENLSQQLLLHYKYLDLASEKSIRERVFKVDYSQDSADMQYLCQELKLTPDEVIAIHCAPTYTVAMIGFLPGFPYLIGLDMRLHIPRKKVPGQIKSGTVAIGGAQCGIYPNDSPGGWYGLGHCEVAFFGTDDEALLKPGDKVKFISR